MARQFKPCARPFFDLSTLRYGRCDRPANHPLGACRGPLSSPGSKEHRELRAEHVKIGQQEGWRS